MKTKTILLVFISTVISAQFVLSQIIVNPPPSGGSDPPIEKISVGTDEISFCEDDEEKAQIRFNGRDLVVENNEVNGNLYLATELDVNLRAGDDAIILGNDNVYLATGPNLGVTRLFVNTEGNVGIGTTSPDSNVEIFETTAKRAELRVTNASDQFRANSGILLNSTYDASTSELIIKNSDWAIVNEGHHGNDGLLGFYYDDDEFESSSDKKMHIRPNGNFWVERQVSAACFDTRGGCDIVEGFDSNETALNPGDVVVIDSENPGKIKKSNIAYDKKILGIISGANGIKPGLKLAQEGVLDGEHLIAMAGQVYVNVTGKVVPGDLLTSANIPGYAQSVSDFENSHGAILGKALSANEEKQGTVLVFVNLH